MLMPQERKSIFTAGIQSLTEQVTYYMPSDVITISQDITLYLIAVNAKYDIGNEKVLFVRYDGNGNTAGGTSQGTE